MLKKFKNKKQAIIMIISTIILLITGTAAIAIIYKNNQENETIEVLSKYGSRGSEVTRIQTKLKRWGYYSGNIDGIYGTQTVKAVKYFQRKNGLTADGIAGPATLKAMGITSSSSTSSSTSSYNSNLNLLARVIYGESRGEVLGNAIDSFESRALAPHSELAEIHYYRLKEDFEMTSGKVASWFGSGGGAEQFVKYKEDGSKYTIDELIKENKLEDSYWKRIEKYASMHNVTIMEYLNIKNMNRFDERRKEENFIAQK